MKIFLDRDVLEETKDRIKYIFDEFEVVMCNYSGGKDSEVLLDLCLKEAEKRGKKLPVVFLDQEAEWASTIERVRSVMYDKRVDPYWIQCEFKLFNATSYENDWLYCWEKGKDDLWIHKKDTISYKENLYGTDRFKQLFERIPHIHFPNKKVATLSGVRAEESPSRFVGLTTSTAYKHITWGRRSKYEGIVSLYPLYDWSFSDIWKYIHDNKLKYNKIYDLQYQYGMSIKDMRVSNLHHETSIKSLFYLQEAEKETYERLVKRLDGIATAGLLGWDDFFPKKLPSMFNSWMEYRDYLLENLLEEKQRKNLKAILDYQDKRYGKYDFYVKFIPSQINAIVANDWEGTKIANLKHNMRYLEREIERGGKYDRRTQKRNFKKV